MKTMQSSLLAALQVKPEMALRLVERENVFAFFQILVLSRTKRLQIFSLE
jgi:hypothetical protein